MKGVMVGWLTVASRASRGRTGKKKRDFIAREGLRAARREPLFQTEKKKLEGLC